jgi:hypothetical protein
VPVPNSKPNLCSIFAEDCSLEDLRAGSYQASLLRFFLMANGKILNGRAEDVLTRLRVHNYNGITFNPCTQWLFERACDSTITRVLQLQRHYIEPIHSMAFLTRLQEHNYKSITLPV